jgi:calmodulin
MALQGIMHAADSGGSSATHTHTSDNDAFFGVRAVRVRARPQHHPSTSTTALHATQLSYQTSSTADYVDTVSDVDMDEVVSSATTTTLSLFSNTEAPPLVVYDNGLESIVVEASATTSTSQPPLSVMSVLKHFQVVEQAGRVTYPHLLETVNTWGRKKHISRRLKFIDMLTPVQTDSLESLFRIVDRDEDGLIDMFDLRAVLDSVKVEEEDAIDDEPPRLGLNGFKKMTSKEFIGIAAEAEFYDLFDETFGGLDVEGNGYVRVEDVTDLLRGLKSICTSFDCNAKLSELIHGSSTPAEPREQGKKHRYVYYKDLITSLLDMKC